MRFVGHVHEISISSVVQCSALQLYKQYAEQSFEWYKPLLVPFGLHVLSITCICPCCAIVLAEGAHLSVILLSTSIYYFPGCARRSAGFGRLDCSVSLSNQLRLSARRGHRARYCLSILYFCPRASEKYLLRLETFIFATSEPSDS